MAGVREVDLVNHAGSIGLVALVLRTHFLGPATHRRGRAIRARVAVALTPLLVVALACAEQAQVATVEPEADSIVGRVFVDVDRDGVVSPGDRLLHDATIRAGVNGTRFVAEWAAETSETGSYRLMLPPAIDESALFVEVELGLGRGATVSVRRAASVGVAIDVALTREPERCGLSPCPGELLPDLIPILDSVAAAPTQPLPPDSWYIDTDTQPGRKLLRFSSAAVNVGDGPLHVVAGERTPSGLRTSQRVWTADLAYTDHEAGIFVFHPDHDHIHLDAFEQYRLLDGDGTEVASAEKVSFCLVDTWPIAAHEFAQLAGSHDNSGQAPAPVMADGLGIWSDEPCGTSEQAINVGWADYYGAELADQWIDITGVPAGDYQVEITVDPANVLRELDETNNRVTFPITVP